MGRTIIAQLVNGFVADESDKRGLDAPVNRVVTEITRRIHAGELEPDPANLELIRTALEQ